MKFVCTCDTCGKPIYREDGDGASGYAIDKLGRRHCFECCADHDRAFMRATGRNTLYLTTSKTGPWRVSNWPGMLEFTAHGRVGRHNIAGRRYDFRFVFDGYWWHGVTYGDNTQIAHCRKTRDRFGLRPARV